MQNEIPNAIILHDVMILKPIMAVLDAGESGGDMNS
jgi:hypothetical protein